MGEWTVVISPADGRARTDDEVAALLPAVGEVIGVRLGRCGDEQRHVSGRGDHPLVGDYWLSGAICDPGDFGRHEAYQLELTVDAMPEQFREMVAAEMYRLLRDDGRFHAVLMCNSAALQATHVDRDSWWT